MKTEFQTDTTLKIWFATAATSRAIPYAKSIELNQNVMVIETFDHKQMLFNFSNINMVETLEGGK